MPGDAQGVTVPLSTLGGLVTEPTPPDCPEGVSPDCQDVVFLPGSVSQRPCLSKIFASAFSGNPTTVYQKSYVQPDESVMNLYLDSANRLWKESPVGSAASLIEAIAEPAGSIKAGLSCTAFGREYIAFSDGTHGAHVPLQWDGTHLDRVTQDGPGGGVSATDEVAAYRITASPNGLRVIAGVSEPIASISEVANVVTVVITVPANISDFHVGQGTRIAGVPVGGYNGDFAVASIDPVAGSYTYILGATGLAASSGGTATPYTIRVSLDDAIPVSDLTNVGLNFTVAGAGVGGYNGPYVSLTAAPAGSATVQFTVLCVVADMGLANSGGGTVTVNGKIGVGAHSVVVMFLTRQGYLTKPSPVASWVSAGNKRVIIKSIPKGPSNVIARVLAFTAAGGDNYFAILANLILPPSPGSTTEIVILPTIIRDNTTTSFVFDFSDTALFGATAIDIAGRNQFAQVVLESAAGFFSYASRMFPWGERNKVQNLLNMGFEGGTYGASTAPTGWSAGKFAVVNGGAWTSGAAIQFAATLISDATTITQPADVDDLGIAIIQPNTIYKFRCWCKAVTALSPTTSIFAAFGGALGVAVIPAAAISSTGGFVEAVFNLRTPPAIPTGTTFGIGATTALIGETIMIDECSLIDSENPYRDSLFRGSYINGPEQFDGVTGDIGSTSDKSPIRNCVQLRNTMYYNTANGKNYTTDNGTGEPSTWSVSGVSQSVGSVSLRGSDPGRLGTGESGEQWEFSISENGLYIFAGSGTDKISQEIQLPCENGKPGWNSINKAALSTAWVKNDLTNRRCCIGVPVGSATAPNVMFVLDYRDLGVPSEIADRPPFRISLSGKVVASDLSRKWTRWNISANCAEILARPGGVYEIAFGAGNGLTPGTGSGFGNAYTLDATKLTDDDYGQVTPYYTTYFFPNPEVSQALGLDYHRLLASYATIFIDGVGNTSITPLSGSLTNAYPAFPVYPLVASIPYSYEWGMNVTGERIALKIGSVPATGTDNGFTLQDLAMTLKKDPIAPLRGSM